ncbi:MAG: hypothetical protein C0467_03745 [Planctomycetaceae bacterium]|nr:hypothetical protein [Planctomycetaceae bacterium]
MKIGLLVPFLSALVMYRGIEMSSEASSSTTPWSVKLGLMMTALIVLVSQIALTRLMSVAVNYHSAFLILAAVMLAMAASAIAVFVGTRRSESPVTIEDAAKAAYKSAIAIAIALLGFVLLASRDWGPLSQPIQLLLAPALFFGGFYYSGYVIALVLSHYVSDLAKLYWFDLVGAAGGCLLVVPLLNWLPAPSVILLCAAGMAFAGTTFSRSSTQSSRKHLIVPLGLLLVWGLSVAWPSLLRLHFAKGQDQSKVLWESWNAQARVSVSTEIPGTSIGVNEYERRSGVKLTPEEIDEARRRSLAGMSMSREFKGPFPNALWVQLDSDAGTPILKDGVVAAQSNGLRFLDWDIATAAYVLRTSLKLPPTDVFIVGGGGGRDVLTALSHGSKRVDVVELNPDVVFAVEQVFGDYSGRVYSDPRVHLTIGEARGELSRHSSQYDLIQMSLIDTWASSMAGAMVMTENSLYTQEAFDLYAARLKPDGLLSITRWYHPSRYGETARVAVLMANALQRAGIQKPADHVAVMISDGGLDTSASTAIMKRSPFTIQEQTALVELCKARGYRLLWPQPSSETELPFNLAGMLRLEPQAVSGGRYDLSPPTDDRPFFFNYDWPVSSVIEAIRTGDHSLASRASIILVAALLVGLFACSKFIVLPLRTMRSASVNSQEANRLFVPTMLYFSGLGIGFMMIELALIQRYILFLGHPSYAISVVLFTLLFFGGCGSYITELVGEVWVIGVARLALFGVIMGTILTAFLVPEWLRLMAGWDWSYRVGVATALITPQALLMGMLFPLGVRRLMSAGQQELVPWVWGINGGCGVIALILGTLVAMNLSYTSVLITGAFAYLVTLMSLSLKITNSHAPSTPHSNQSN